jgi:hypothetical protein
MRRGLSCLVIVAAGCGHPAPAPTHTATELPVTGTATFAGAWVTSDDMDWGYRLVIAGDGRFTVVVDRGKLGRCEQRGKLAAAADPKSYKLTLVTDSCSPTGAGGGSLAVTIPSYTGESLTLAYTVGTTETRRTYQRDPTATRPN